LGWILVLVPLNIAVSWWPVSLLGAAGPTIGSAVSVAAGQPIPNICYFTRDLARRRQQAARANMPSQKVSAGQF
jgi:hypothetical protein